MFREKIIIPQSLVFIQNAWEVQYVVMSNVKLFCFQANFPVINGWWAGPVCLSVCT